MISLMQQRRSILAIVALMVMVLPLLAFAQGLVPCGDGGRAACQFCHVAQLMNNVIGWLVAFLTVVAAILFAVAGLRLVTSSGNQAAKESAKKIITNTIIGYVIVLGAWLLIDFGMKSLLSAEGQARFGTWNAIQCVAQPRAAVERSPLWSVPGRLTATGANRNVFSPADVAASVASIRNAGDVRAMAEQAAREAGLTGRQIDTFVALVQQESSMCQNKVGPSTKYGRAYGCSQMLLTTAQGLDPSATPDRLTNDDAYSLALGAQYFASRLDIYDGNERLALAAYNGGTKANEQSSNCPGQLAWECEVNQGYEQTRNYVANINAMVDSLSGG